MPDSTLDARPRPTLSSTPLAEALKITLASCRNNEWAGYDPYDALNSEVFGWTPLRHSRFFRLALTQGLKRLPINLRPLLLVPKEQNPKGIALFASTLIKLAPLRLAEPEESQVLLDRLIALRTQGVDQTCWGYNFDWQTRTYLVPKFTPNIICTTFAGNALLDGYEAYERQDYVEHAISAGKFLLKGLNRSPGRSSFCFGYTTLDHSQIHNANLLGAAFLARLYRHTGDAELRAIALEAARFSVDLQKADGSWPYGEGRHQAWIDSFHTGYNLVALERISDCLQENSWVEASLKKGFRFFLDHFFKGDGIVKYYHDRVYPIDVHAIAQAIMTLVDLQHYDPEAMPLARRVCQWALDHMRNRAGSFIYQRHLLYKNPINYIRWGQAWMLLAMATLLEAEAEEIEN